MEPRRVAGFLAAPGATLGATRLVLLHGDDAGLVRERATMLLRAVLGGEDDPFRLAEVTREAAARDPRLLADEAAAVPLTGGRRVVRVRDAGDALAPAAERVLQAERPGGGPGAAPGGLVLLEGGELPGRSRLRALLEPAEGALVIACYRERGAELGQAIVAILDELGVKADRGAVDWLSQRLGEDRLLMRRELEKLALYVGEGGRVTEDGAAACIGEGTTLDLEEALMAATVGDAVATDRALEAAFAEGETAVGVVRAALRHLQRLQSAVLAMQGGATPQTALAGLRPPVFFRHRPAFERALRLWSPARLDAAGAALLETERRTKTTGLPENAVARMALLDVARMARR
nr:DNA polymerase III subunit delta [Roseomonas acroporae]